MRLRERTGALSWHSLILTTAQPLAASARDTSWSRRIFRFILLFQNSTDDVGTRLHLGHPCQKHPSMNTATLALGKAKSGLPNKGSFRRQPLSLACLNSSTALISVLVLPLLRVRAITRDR
jgi:hypothetical protein